MVDGDYNGVAVRSPGGDRKGDWIQTYTGRCFWPLDPRPEDIFILDIAHSLSMQCRYNGHTKRFYSVAEHCVIISKLVPPEHALWGLLHDVAESYTSDIPRPLKRNLQAWAPMEEKIMNAVCLRFGLQLWEPPDVTDKDIAICTDERDMLMNPCDREWGLMKPSPGARGLIHCYEPSNAERLFKRRCLELMPAEMYSTCLG